MKSRGLVYIVAAAMLAGCSGATDTPLTTPAERAAFVARMEPRIEVCILKAGRDLQISQAVATTFCRCQMEVFAERFSSLEMELAARSAFGPSLSALEAMTVLSATRRVIPERDQRCGPTARG